MPTIRDQRDKLKRLKRELEQGEPMETMRGAVALTAQSVDEQGRSWIEVMPIAEKAKNGPHFFTLMAEDLQAAASFLQANPDRIPIDYDHAGAEGGSTKAAGWFTGNAEVRGKSLWAEVKWTPAAVQEIRDGSFRFISPEWTMENKDAKTGLWTTFKEMAAATLTNRPFFSDLAPVTAKEVLVEMAQDPGLTDDDREELLALLSKPEQEGGESSATDQDTTTEEEEIIVADEQPVTDYMKMLGLDDTVDPKHRLAAAFRDKDEKILALEQKVTELTATSGEKGREAEELASRIEELEQKDRQRDIEVILSRAVDKGRVFPAEKETLAELFASDVTGLKRMIATRPAEMFAQLEPKGVSGEPDRFIDDPEVSQYVNTIDSGGDAVDTEQAKQHLMAMDLLREQGKSDNYTNDEYVAAYNRAASLVY